MPCIAPLADIKGEPASSLFDSACFGSLKIESLLWGSTRALSGELTTVLMGEVSNSVDVPICNGDGGGFTVGKPTPPLLLPDF